MRGGVHVIDACVSSRAACRCEGRSHRVKEGCVCVQRRVVTTRASRVRASRDADGGRRRTVGGRSGGDRNRGACGTTNQSLSNPYVRVHPSQATTPPYRVLLRCKPPRLARDLARGPRITHTHTRALTAARCLLNTTHISIHRAPPISHHACIIIAYMVGCPARRQIPAPTPLHHTRATLTVISRLYTRCPTPHRRAYQSFTCAEWPPHGSTCVAREHASNIQTQRPNENERRTPPVFFESKESDRRIPLPALTFGCWM